MCVVVVTDHIVLYFTFITSLFHFSLPYPRTALLVFSSLQRHSINNNCMHVPRGAPEEKCIKSYIMFPVVKKKCNNNHQPTRREVGKKIRRRRTFKDQKKSETWCFAPPRFLQLLYFIVTETTVAATHYYKLLSFVLRFLSFCLTQVDSVHFSVEEEKEEERENFWSNCRIWL